MQQRFQPGLIAGTESGVNRCPRGSPPDSDRPCLPQAVHPVDGLVLDRWVPVDWEARKGRQQESGTRWQWTAIFKDLHDSKQQVLSSAASNISLLPQYNASSMLQQSLRMSASGTALVHPASPTLCR